MALIMAHLAILTFCGLAITIVMVIYLWCSERGTRNTHRKLDHKKQAEQYEELNQIILLVRGLTEPLFSNHCAQAPTLPTENDLPKPGPILNPTEPASPTTSPTAIEIHTHA